MDCSENLWAPKTPGPLIPVNTLVPEVVPWTPGNDHEAHGPPRSLHPLALAVGPCGLWTPKTPGAPGNDLEAHDPPRLLKPTDLLALALSSVDPWTQEIPGRLGMTMRVMTATSPQSMTTGPVPMATHRSKARSTRAERPPDYISHHSHGPAQAHGPRPFCRLHFPAHPAARRGRVLTAAGAGSGSLRGVGL